MQSPALLGHFPTVCPRPVNSHQSSAAGDRGLSMTHQCHPTGHLLPLLVLLEGSWWTETMGRPCSLGTPPDTSRTHLQAKLQAAGPHWQPGPQPCGYLGSYMPGEQWGHGCLSLSSPLRGCRGKSQPIRMCCPNGDGCGPHETPIPHQGYLDVETLQMHQGRWSALSGMPQHIPPGQGLAGSCRETNLPMSHV